MENLPEGFTREMVEKYADYLRKKNNEYRRKDYAAHPDRVLKQRIRSARNLLQREGFVVLTPEQADQLMGGVGNA